MNENFEQVEIANENEKQKPRSRIAKGRVALYCRLHEEAKEKLQTICEQEDRSESWIIEHLINQEFEKLSPKN